MIVVSSTRSSHTSDEYMILTKPSAKLESLGPGIKSFLSLVAFHNHERGEDHMQPLTSRALPTACFYA